MYELKKNWKVCTSKFVGTGPSSYEKRIYRAAVSQRLRNTGLDPNDVQNLPNYSGVTDVPNGRAVQNLSDSDVGQSLSKLKTVIKTSRTFF